MLYSTLFCLATVSGADIASAKPLKPDLDGRLAEKGLHQYDKPNPAAYQQLKHVPVNGIGTEVAAKHRFDNIAVFGDFHGDLFQGLTVFRGMQIVEYNPHFYADQIKDVNKDGKIDEEDGIGLAAEEKMNNLFVFNKRGSLMGGATADQYHWKAENTLVVICGDAMNGGPDDIELIRLFMRLDGEAQQKNSRLIYLYGNHEVNNLMSNFVGVHPQSFIKSGGRSGRVRLLSMEDPVGRYLRTRPALFEYDGLIFMHGGLFPSSLDAIRNRLQNKTAQKTFQKHGSGHGNLPADFAEEINSAVRDVLTGKTPLHKNDLADLILNYRYDENGADSPLLIHPLYECDKVHEVNKALGIQAQVVGHTPHALPIFEFCHGELFAVDFLMSRWKGGEGSGVGALLLSRSFDVNNVTATIQHLNRSRVLKVNQGDHPVDKKGNNIKIHTSVNASTTENRKAFHRRHKWHWNAHLIVPDEAEVAADERGNAGGEEESTAESTSDVGLSLKHPIMFLVAVCLGVILVELVRTWCVDR